MFDSLTRAFSSIVTRIKGNHSLKEGNIRDAVLAIKKSLLDADVPHEIVTDFVAGVESDVIGKKVVGSLKPGEQFAGVVYNRLKEFFGASDNSVVFGKKKSVVMVLGLQGSGKTTSLAKMVHYVRNVAHKGVDKKPSIMVMSVDYYRPAAIKQLSLLAQRLGVYFYQSEEKTPVAAVRKGYEHFKKNGYDYFFVDTAGRLHVDDVMLQELHDIDDLLKPQYKIFVLDAMTGQESLRVARTFDERIGFDAAMLSKMDSDVRSGAAFSFYYAIKKPILFIGTGEKIVDIERFRPERMPGRLLGQGDMQTLAEKADAVVQKEQQSSMRGAFMRGGALTLQDFADQLGVIRKMGSLSSLMRYIPGVGAQNVTSSDLEKGEVEMGRWRAILDSMTQKERVFPRLLDQSRKKRIARGAGVQVTDINLLLSKFEQMQQYVKLFKRFGKRGRR